MKKVKTSERLPDKNGVYFVYMKESLEKDIFYWNNHTIYWIETFEYWIDESDDSDNVCEQSLKSIESYFNNISKEQTKKDLTEFESDCMLTITMTEDDYIEWCESAEMYRQDMIGCEKYCVEHRDDLIFNKIYNWESSYDLSRDIHEAIPTGEFDYNIQVTITKINNNDK